MDCCSLLQNCVGTATKSRSIFLFFFLFFGSLNYLRCIRLSVNLELPPDPTRIAALIWPIIWSGGQGKCYWMLLSRAPDRLCSIIFEGVPLSDSYLTDWLQSQESHSITLLVQDRQKLTNHVDKAWPAPSPSQWPRYKSKRLERETRSSIMEDIWECSLWYAFHTRRYFAWTEAPMSGDGIGTAQYPTFL